MTPLDFQSRKQNFLTKLRNASKASERENQDSKAGDQNSSQEQKKLWYKNYGAVINRYLQEVHSIQTINGLTKKLNAANCNHDTVRKEINISFRTLDSIVKACEKWKPYLKDQEAFDTLVCIEVLSMVKIHTSVVSARNFHKRQGPAGVQLKEGVEVPYLFVTIVTFYGHLQVFS